VILAWLSALCLVGAGFLGARWTLNRYDALGRRRAFPGVAVGALVVVAVVALIPVFVRVRLEARLADAASAIVGSRVSVHCQAFGEAFVDAGQELGYVRFTSDGLPEQKTLIKRQQCRDLRSYLRDPSEVTRDHVVAVHTLTHEAIHMSGVANEAETECLAVQRNAETAMHLGAAREDAQQLAVYYWENVYPSMPASYRKEGCAGPIP